MTVDLVRLRDALSDFAATIHGARGFYLDARVGFLYGHDRIQKFVRQSRDHDPSHDPEKVAFIYGFGPPEDRSFQHVVSQAEAMRRMANGGQNHVVLGHWFVVVVYQFWETRHRTAIASALGIPPKELTVPVMGDLRRLRHAILHERGRLTPETAAKLEALTFLEPIQSLSLSVLDIDRIAHQVTEAVRALLISVGIDPTVAVPTDQSTPDP